MSKELQERVDKIQQENQERATRSIKKFTYIMLAITILLAFWAHSYYNSYNDTWVKTMPSVGCISGSLNGSDFCMGLVMEAKHDNDWGNRLAILATLTGLFTIMLFAVLHASNKNNA